MPIFQDTLWTDVWDGFGGARGDIFVYDSNRRLYQYFCADQSIAFAASADGASWFKSLCNSPIPGGLANSTNYARVRDAAVRAGESDHRCKSFDGDDIYQGQDDDDNTAEASSKSPTDDADARDDDTTVEDDDASDDDAELVSANKRVYSRYRQRRGVRKHKKHFTTFGWLLILAILSSLVALTLLLIRWRKYRDQISNMGNAMLSKLHSADKTAFERLPTFDPDADEVYYNSNFEASVQGPARRTGGYNSMAATGDGDSYARL
jgi:hypothetical protein